MAFNGYLLKLNGSTFPLKYIYKESYKVTPNRVQDLDPKRVETGVLYRNALSHTVTTIQFQTKPMWNSDMSSLMSFIRSSYSNASEKKVTVNYYSPDINAYKTGTFYVPDIEFEINMIDTSKNKILYNSTTIEFIEY
jgi:hypothetical protein